MKYCYEIFKSDKSIERRRSAIELLRVVADRRALAWIHEFLEDKDTDIQNWGIGVLDQLFQSGLIEIEDGEDLLLKAENHPNLYIRKEAKFIKDFHFQ